MRKKCRVGGGLRDLERVLQAVHEGAQKVIVGSAAFTSKGINHELLGSLRASLPREKVMIAGDCLGDRVATHGWREALAMTSREAVAELEPYCSEFLSTHTDWEGRLQGTDLE